MFIMQMQRLESCNVKRTKELMSKLEDERTSLTFLKRQEHKYRTVEPYTRYWTVIKMLTRLMSGAYSASGKSFDPPSHSTLRIATAADIQGFKPFCLSNELFEAFQQSEMSRSLVEFKRVVPCGLLFLPSTIAYPDGEKVKWIMFHHVLFGEPEQLVYFFDGTVVFPEGLVSVPEKSRIEWFSITEKGIGYTGCVRIDISEGKIIYDFVRGEPCTLSHEERIISDKISDILLQTLLYLQTNPDELQQVVVPIQTKAKGSASWHKPICPVIGKDYQIKRDS